MSIYRILGTFLLVLILTLGCSKDPENLDSDGKITQTEMREEGHSKLDAGQADDQNILRDRVIEACNQGDSACQSKCSAGQFLCGGSCCDQGNECKGYQNEKKVEIKCCVPPYHEPCGSCDNLCNIQSQKCLNSRKKCICKDCDECEEHKDGFCLPGQTCTHDKQVPCCSKDSSVSCGSKCCPHGQTCDQKYKACLCSGCSVCPSADKLSYTICDQTQRCGTKSNLCMTLGSEDCGGGIICSPNYICTGDSKTPCCPASSPDVCGSLCCATTEECQTVNGKSICVLKGWKACASSSTTHVLCDKSQTCSTALRKCIGKTDKDCQTHVCAYDFVCVKAPLKCCLATTPKPCYNISKCCPQTSSCGSSDCIPAGHKECISGDKAVKKICNSLQDCCLFEKNALCVPKGAKCTFYNGQYCYCESPYPYIAKTRAGPKCWPNGVQECEEKALQTGYCPTQSECRAVCVCKTCKIYNQTIATCCRIGSGKINCSSGGLAGCPPSDNFPVMYGLAAKCVK